MIFTMTAALAATSLVNTASKLRIPPILTL